MLKPDFGDVGRRIEWNDDRVAWVRHLVEDRKMTAREIALDIGLAANQTPRIFELCKRCNIQLSGQAGRGRNVKRGPIASAFRTIAFWPRAPALADARPGRRIDPERRNRDWRHLLRKPLGLGPRDLTPAQRAKLIAKRKAAYEAVHPETKSGGDRRANRQNGGLKDSFAKDTAAKSRKPERTIQRDATLANWRECQRLCGPAGRLV